MIFDSHCHLDFDAFAADLPEVLERARQAGVTRFMVPGTQAKTWSAVRELAQRESACEYALGLHPYFLLEHQDKDLAELEKCLQTWPEIRAVGEIGLDAHLKHLPLPLQDNEALQLHYFSAQLVLAKRYHKPVIIHVRHRHEAVLKALSTADLKKGGVIHAFNGSVELAQRYVDLGFKLGLGSILTYQNAHKLRKVVQTLPLSCFVVETDAPDMPMQGRFGERNQPCFISDVIEVLVQLRSESKIQLLDGLWHNTLSLFALEG